MGDRWRRTRVMIFADLLRAAAVAGLAFAPLREPLWALLVLVALFGIGEGIFQPTFGAVVPRVLPAHLLQPGNGLNAFSQQLATVVGPGVAGVLVATLGVDAVLWLNAGTFLFSFATLVPIREAALAASGAERVPGIRGALRQVGGDLREGVAAVLGRPWLAATLGVITAVMVLVTAPSLVVLPVEARERLGGAEAYGWTLAAMGVGALAGSLAGGRIRARRVGVVAIAGALTIAGSVAGLALLPLPGVLAAWAVGGAGVTLFNVLWATAMQRDVPEHLLARVMALNWFGIQGLMPLGYALAGPAVAAFGSRAVLLAGAVLALVVTPLPLLVRGGATFSSREP
uniref:Integral membrane efflux protein n=1 Tax=uncultured bacterium AB_1383 TaxID=1630010 RepID=A0A0E3GLV7_9BACT|nr:integral membrane efflux protein [uncultured bacterium AB_1383]